jgi:hypothetical protein
MPYLGAEINVGLEYATSNYTLLSVKTTATMLSLDAAPRLKVQFPLTNDLRIFAYAGPTLSYNLIYNDKAEVKMQKIWTVLKIYISILTLVAVFNTKTID